MPYPQQSLSNAPPTGQGLLSPQQAQPMPPPMAPQQSGAVNPKAQFDKFMSFAMKVIHDQNVSDNMANTLLGMKDKKMIIDYIARSTLDVLSRVEQASDKAGEKITNEVKLAAGNQIMGEVLNIAEIVGVKKLSDEEKGQAFSLCVSMYLDQSVKTGKMTPEEMQQLSEQLSQSPEGQKVEQTKAELMANRGKGKQKQPMKGRGIMAPQGGM